MGIIFTPSELNEVSHTLAGVSGGSTIGLILIWSLPLIAAVVFALWGALHMRQGHRYKTAVLAAATACVIPFLPANFFSANLTPGLFLLTLLGPAAGVWASVVLRRKAVREHFAAVAGTAPMPYGSWHWPVSGALVAAVAVYGVPLGIYLQSTSKIAPSASGPNVAAESMPSDPGAVIRAGDGENAPKLND